MDCENEFLASMNAGMRGNMKRKIAWILLAAMTLSIAACGNKTGDPVADDGNITAEATEGRVGYIGKSGRKLCRHSG